MLLSNAADQMTKMSQLTWKVLLVCSGLLAGKSQDVMGTSSLGNTLEITGVHCDHILQMGKLGGGHSPCLVDIQS